jgi:hypothetical protein
MNVDPAAPRMDNLHDSSQRERRGECHEDQLYLACSSDGGQTIRGADAALGSIFFRADGTSRRRPHPARSRAGAYAFHRVRGWATAHENFFRKSAWTVGPPRAGDGRFGGSLSSFCQAKLADCVETIHPRTPARAAPSSLSAQSPVGAKHGSGNHGCTIWVPGAGFTSIH